jgi:hypothetical protein
MNKEWLWECTCFLHGIITQVVMFDFILFCNLNYSTVVIITSVLKFYSFIEFLIMNKVKENINIFKMLIRLCFYSLEEKQNELIKYNKIFEFFMFSCL